MMKLNPDLVRDVLLAVEESTDSTHFFEYEKDNAVPKQLQKYSHNEILYHFQQCNMSGFFVGYQSYDGGQFCKYWRSVPRWT